MSTATAVKTKTRRLTDHRLYITMSVTALAIAFAGFVPGMVNPAGRLAPMTMLVAVHGFFYFLWMLLFLTQTILVAAGHVAVHRRLGLAAIALAAIMIPLGYASSVAMGRRGFDLSGDINAKADPLFQMVFQLGDLLTFATLVSAGLWFRRRPDLHKRFVLLGTIGGMMPAALAHFIGHNLREAPNLIVPMLALLLLSPAIYDRVRLGRFHPVSLWGGLVVFVWANLRAVVIGPSEAWHQFARWLIS